MKESGYASEVYFGRSRNGAKRVTVYFEDGSGRCILRVGGAEIICPNVQFAFTAAVSWMEGRPHYQMRDCREDDK